MLGTIQVIVIGAMISAGALADTVILQPSAAPASAQPLASVSVTGSGFPTGIVNAAQTMLLLQPATANAGPSVTVPATGLTLVTGTTRRVAFTIPAALSFRVSTPYQIMISGSSATGTAFQSGSFASVTILPGPMLTDVNPSSGPPGQTVVVQLTGSLTSWVQGSTFANFGSGITVGNGQSGAAGLVTVTSPTSASATLIIDSNAAYGARNITVQVGQSIATLTNGFTVTQAPVVPASLTLNTSTNPATGTPGSVVSVAGTGFPVGTISPQNVTVLLAPLAQNGGPSSNVVAVSITPSSGTGTRTITFPVPATFQPTTPTQYAVTLSGASDSNIPFSSSNKSLLTVTPATGSPALISVTPSFGSQGQQMAILITGSNTAFRTSSVVSFGAGITVSSVVANNPTSLTATISINSAASAGKRTLSVLSGPESLALSNAFTVLSGPGSQPAIISFSPGVMSAASSASFTVTAANTHFVQGVTKVDLGPEVIVSSIVVNSSTNITGQITVSGNAAAGFRTPVITTGVESVSLTNGFSVSGPQISITAPADLTYTALPSVTITGTISDPSATVTVNNVNAPNQAGSFTAGVPLKEGSNLITARAVSQGGATSANNIQVFLDTTPPKVSISSPVDGQQFTDSTATVSGMVNDIVFGTVNQQQAQVTVNGVAATVQNRSYVATGIPLATGSNKIQVTATDRVGNSGNASVTVTRATPSLVQISAVSGNNQTGPVATTLATPIVAQFKDASNRPLANSSVTFRVTGNDSLVSATQRSAGVTAISALTDSQGLASCFWTLGRRAGAGNNRVEAFGTGVTAPAVFTASGTATAAAQILVDSGQNQTGAANDILALPFVAIVTDSNYNRLPGIPVTFQVQSGSGFFNGSSSFSSTTDSDGRSSVLLQTGGTVGNSNNVVIATCLGCTNRAVFTASAVAPQPTGGSSVTGVVLDGSNAPISGVTMRVYQINQGPRSNLPLQVGASVTTNGQGQFTIGSLPSGLFKLMADGTTATGKYPSLEFDLTLVQGQTTTVSTPIYLPALDSANQLCVSGTTGGTLTLPSSPGFSLTVDPGSATFPGGSKSGCITVTPVNIDKVPMSPGFGQQPRFIVTIQPVGTTFNPPASISIPNVDGLKPRQVTEMYSYDHDLAAFVSIGTGTVSADGLIIRSDPGVGVLKAGWHCGGNPASTGTTASCPTCTVCRGTLCTPDDTQSCDDRNPCTSCKGKDAGPDCCDGGDCKGKLISSDTGGTKSITVDFNDIINFILQFTQVGCDVVPIINGNFSATPQQTCCYSGGTQREVSAENIDGSLSLGVGVSCGFDLAIPYVEATANLSLSASGSFGASGISYNDPADAKQCQGCSFEKTASANVNISASVSIKAGEFLDVECGGGGSAPGPGGSSALSISTTYSCRTNRWSPAEACIGPIKVFCKFILVGLFSNLYTYEPVPRKCIPFGG